MTNLSMLQIWKKLETQKNPKYFNGITRIEFSEFQKGFITENIKYIQKIAEILYSGNVIILPKVFKPNILKDLRLRVFEWAKKEPLGSHKIFKSSKDVHFYSDNSMDDTGGYQSIDHTHYFFHRVCRFL